MIRPCKCAHTAQDGLHGKGNRVYNEVVRKDGNNVARCTVCGTEVGASAPKAKEKKVDKGTV